MKTLQYILFAIIVWAFYFACEQKVSNPTESILNGIGGIKGKIIDGYTNRPVSSSIIFTSPNSDTLISDSLGYYRANSLSSGIYEVICFKSGFFPDTQSVNILADSIINIDFILKHNNLFAVTDSLIYNIVESARNVHVTINNFSDHIYFLNMCSELEYAIEKYNDSDWQIVQIPGCFFMYISHWVAFQPGQSLNWTRQIFQNGKYRIHFPYSISGDDDLSNSPKLYTNEFYIY